MLRTLTALLLSTVLIACAPTPEPMPDEGIQPDLADPQLVQATRALGRSIFDATALPGGGAAGYGLEQDADPSRKGRSGIDAPFTYEEAVNQTHVTQNAQVAALKQDLALNAAQMDETLSAMQRVLAERHAALANPSGITDLSSQTRPNANANSRISTFDQAARANFVEMRTAIMAAEARLTEFIEASRLVGIPGKRTLIDADILDLRIQINEMRQVLLQLAQSI